MSDPIEVIPYNKEWVEQFTMIGSKIRKALGKTAVRIDHIGSTSVPHLDAKPIIDIQVSVLLLERPGQRRVHVHVRETGSWSEQCALLFRDYMRNHPDDCMLYADTKYRLMDVYKYERAKYVDAKGPIIWDIMRKASAWSQVTGWYPGTSDL